MTGNQRNHRQQTVLVEQEYQNKFDEKIQHTFEAERKRTCIGQITVQKGVIFDKGKDISFLKLTSFMFLLFTKAYYVKGIGPV